jgi:HEAT repeat protein
LTPLGTDASFLALGHEAALRNVNTMRRVNFRPLLLTCVGAVLSVRVAAQSAPAGDLASSDAAKRAAAACEAGRSGSQGAPHVASLVELLADVIPVPAVHCGSYHMWVALRREGVLAEQSTTPAAEAAEALARIGPVGITALVQSTRSGDWRVRQHAVYGIGHARRATDTAPLADRAMELLRDHHPQVRRAAATSLGELDDRRAVRPLVAAVRDADWDVRRAVAWALGELDDPEAAPHVAAMLKDESPAVREAAAWALGELGRTDAVEPLVAALRDRDQRVRKTAAWALGEIGHPHAVDGLVAALKDENAQVRRTAAWALGEIR